MPTTLSKPVSSSESFVIGSGVGATTLSLPKPTPSWVPGSAKGKEEAAVLFKAIATRLNPHIAKHTLSELLEPFSVILDFHTDTCAADVATTLKKVALAFFNPDQATMSVLSFYDWSGTSLRAAANVEDRFHDDHGVLAYVQVQSCLNVSHIDARLPDKTHRLTFFLGLPQSPSPADPAIANLAQQADQAANPDPEGAGIPASARKGVIPAGNGAAGARGYTYTGNFDFLEDKTHFDATFGPDLDNIEILPANAFANGTNNTGISAVQCFEPLSRLLAFPLAYQIMWSESISGDTKAGTVSFHSIFAALRKLSFYEPPANGKGAGKFYDPTELYRRFQPFVILLSTDDADVETWGESLFSVYTANLQPEVNDLIRDPTKEFLFMPPPLRKLATYQAQTQALQLARTKAQSAHDSIQSTLDLILHTQASQTKQPAATRAYPAYHALHNFELPPFPESANPQPPPFQHAFLPHQLPHSNPSPPPSNFHDFSAPVNHSTAFYQQHSPAEQVIQQNTFPRDPKSNYQSPYHLGFKGCLGCGEPSHQFRDCPERNNPDVVSRFHQNFRAHRPNHQRSDRNPRRPDTTAPNHYGARDASTSRPQPQRETSYNRNDRIFQANSATTPAQRVLPSPPDSQQPHVRGAFPTFARINNAIVLPRNRPPISTDNNLGNISIPLASADGLKVTELVGLLDTGASVTTGAVSLHMWLMVKFPECVVSLELAHDPELAFPPIQLSGCLRDDPAAPPNPTHGQLFAVATYRSTFRSEDGSFAEFRVALGHDNSLNTIFGLPMLRALGLLIDFKNNQIFSPRLGITLPLEYFEPQLFQPPTPYTDDFITEYAAILKARPSPSHTPSKPSVCFANPISSTASDFTPPPPLETLPVSGHYEPRLAPPPAPTTPLDSTPLYPALQTRPSTTVSTTPAQPARPTILRPPSCPPSLPSPFASDASSSFDRPMFHFCRPAPAHYQAIDVSGRFQHNPIAPGPSRNPPPAARSLFSAPSFARTANSTLAITPDSVPSSPTSSSDFPLGG